MCPCIPVPVCKQNPCHTPQGPTCSRTGGGKKLKKIVDDMAAPFGIEVETIKCVSECAECGLGPNIGVTDKDAEGPFAEKIVNGVKTGSDVARILGVPEPQPADP